MIYLSQRDRRWAEDLLGSSALKVWRWGCTTTDISMISDYFKCYRSPKDLAHNANNYTKSGLVLWNNLKFDCMKFDWREYQRNDAKIQQYLKDPKTAVLLQVDNEKHWVVGVRPANWAERLIHKNDYVIVDPWDGKKKWLLPTYRNITGAAYFSAK